MSKIEPQNNSLSDDFNRELRACVTRGLNWTIENLPMFVPENVANPENMKEITELALMYSFINQWNDSRLKLQTIPIEEFLLDFFDDPLIVQCARKMPNHFDHYFIAYMTLRMAGHRLEKYEKALGSIQKYNYPNCSEKTPYRTLELQYMQWKAGLMEEPPDWQSIYRSTTLGLCPNPVFLSEWEVYSITHTLFYLTDFCGLTMHLPRDENQDVIKVLESLLIYYWKKADWDITGELLINMVALGRSNTSLFKTAALEFLRAWRLDGALPGPHFSLSNEVPDQKNLFENCYHTTLIGILFCGSYIRRNIHIN
ncbi:DUF6895 family protein [Bacillus thuringiensis]|uniref:DUF6895 family protein n=1 Tax=Bacillus thuringiensis TaxID=1428 RepID=UPI000BF313C3|nr:hypothetical protein [Bacillus thuringiensis]PFD99142.1 hypothetical protein CN303_31120 [Bacillus thuringiensis]